MALPVPIHVVERNVICMPDVKTINVFAVWEHTDQEKLVNNSVPVLSQVTIGTTCMTVTF